MIQQQQRVRRIDAKGNVTDDQVVTFDVADDVANIDVVRQRLAAYLALPAPTPAQNIKALKGLVRLVLWATDDVSDT